MKKTILSTTLATLSLIASAFMASPAIITNYHHHYTEGPFTITNTCNGENILVTEVVTEDVYSVINDNTDHFTYHFKIDWSGDGDQGNTYHGTLNQNESKNASLQNGAFTDIIEGHSILLSNGSAPNIKETVLKKITVTPNGDIAVETQNKSSQCFF